MADMSFSQRYRQDKRFKLAVEDLVLRATIEMVGLDPEALIEQWVDPENAPERTLLLPDELKAAKAARKAAKAPTKPELVKDPDKAAAEKEAAEQARKEAAAEKKAAAKKAAAEKKAAEKKAANKAPKSKAAKKTTTKKATK